MTVRDNDLLSVHEDVVVTSADDGGWVCETDAECLKNIEIYVDVWTDLQKCEIWPMWNAKRCYQNVKFSIILKLVYIQNDVHINRFVKFCNWFCHGTHLYACGNWIAVCGGESESDPVIAVQQVCAWAIKSVEGTIEGLVQVARVTAAHRASRND